MLRIWLLFVCVATAALAFCVPAAVSAPAANAEEEQRKETMKVMAQYKGVVDKGLEWLKKNQDRQGFWAAQGEQHRIVMTAIAGLALMAEGSTPTQGKYSKQIDDAVEYLIKKSQKNGMIGDPQDQNDRHRYMYGHGFGLMFLATVYGEETDQKRRADLEKVLTRAVEFTIKAQTSLGGWGYVSAADGQDFDEGSTVVPQLQSIRAARNAGIPIPEKVIKDAIEYYKKSSFPKHGDKPEDFKKVAGVIYSARNMGGSGTPPLTAAGLVGRFSFGDYNSAVVSQWLNFTAQQIPIDKSGRDSFGHWEYTHFYYAQAMYMLGEDRHAKMRPDLDDAKLLKWSKYRKVIFEYLKEKQQPDGSWPSGVGPVFSTGLHLCMLQLDKANLPIFQR